MKLKRLLPIVFSAVLLTVLLIWMDPRRLIPILASADLRWMAAALALVTLNRVYMAAKWNLLLRARSVHIGWWDAIRAYYVSTFLGVFLPPTVGADIARTLLVRRDSVPTVEVVASILVERLIGLLSLLAFGTISCIVILLVTEHQGLHMESVLRVTLATIVATTILFLMSFASWFGRWVSWGLASIRRVSFLRRYTGKLQGLYEAYRSSRTTLSLRK